MSVATVWAGIAAAAAIVWLVLRLNAVTRRARESTDRLIEALENGDAAYMPRVADRTIEGNLEAIRKMLLALRAESSSRDHFLNMVLERSSTGIVVFRCSDGRALMSNRAALRLLGRSVVTSVRQFAGSRLGQLLERKECTTSGGEVMTLGNCLAIVCVSEFEDQGDEYLMLTLDDATSAVADRDMESWMRFSQVVVHEFNNAIMPIISLTGNVLDSSEGEAMSDGVRQQLKTIVSASDYLRNFVNSYRHLTHMPDPAPKAFLLRDFLARCVNLVYCIAGNGDDAKSVIDIDIAGNEDVMVYSDEGMLSQSIVNLLKNAVENSCCVADGGRVTVRGRLQDDESVTIEIADNGPEIPDEIADKVFIPFFTTKPKGSGIGLALSRQLLRRNGGASVELMRRSPHPVFRIVIP